ncbi:hypothetical protein ACN2XU_23810 [Primorskyibacter sp. 2E107]|uniref:hypothetical protein n=1 Tax=Primorskyibacter sp. 2E107 TaxID=3403458 RepID=UPI003AF6A54A
MSKTGEIPYTWEEIEAEVRDAIRCQASILETFGPCFKDCNIAMDFLGLPRELHADLEFSMEAPPDFDLERHVIHHLAKEAYRYAYQLDGCWDCDVHVWHEVDTLLQGYPQTDAEGNGSPFCTLNDFPLRRMFETFFARYSLFERETMGDPDIRELSLLANMTVPAVRTSLSKEGFKLERSSGVSRSNQEDKSFRLPREDAILWLSRRRGFIPQRTKPEGEAVREIVVKTLADETMPFHTRIAQAIGLLGEDLATFATAAGLDTEWFDGLMAGRPVSPDVQALRGLAKALGMDEPAFAGTGVRHLLTIDISGDAADPQQ